MAGMKRGIIYLRVSTQEQKDSRLGLESQERLCRDYCRQNDVVVVDVYRDEAVSGSIPLYEREGGKGVIDAVRFSNDLLVVALCQDRLFRSVIDCLATLELWSEWNVTAVMIDGGEIDYQDDESWRMATLKAFFAEDERRRARSRTRRALVAAKARGQKLGVAPFGSVNAVTFDDAGKKLNAGVHNVNADEQKVIARIRELARFCRLENGRVNLTEIARTLTAEGYATRNSGEWTHVQVKNILRRIA